MDDHTKTLQEAFLSHMDTPQPDTIDALQQEIFIRSNELFPDRTPAKAFLKLFEELGEVIKDPTNPMEWADVFILILDLSKMFDVNIAKAVRYKFEILEKREWCVTATGTYQHISGGNEHE